MHLANKDIIYTNSKVVMVIFGEINSNNMDKSTKLDIWHMKLSHFYIDAIQHINQYKAILELLPL